MTYYTNFRYSKGPYSRVALSGVYSWRTGSHRNDRGQVPVYGESLVSRSAKGLTGIVGYLNNYKAALSSLNQEINAPESSALGEEVYSKGDLGHVFATYSVKTPTYITFFDPYAAHRQRLFGAFVMPVLARERKFFSNVDWIFSSVPEADVTNTIQRLIWSNYPDRMKGSVGQDAVDLINLPHLISRLYRFASEMGNVSKTWRRLSSQARESIDNAFKHPARHASQAYLEWMFVLKPYIEDYKALSEALGALASRQLKRVSYTSNSEEIPLSSGTTTDFKSYVADDLNMEGMNAEMHYSTRYSVHVACAFTRRASASGISDLLYSKRNLAAGFVYPSLWFDTCPWTWLLNWALDLSSAIDRSYAYNYGRYIPLYCWASVRLKTDFGVLPRTVTGPWGMRVDASASDGHSEAFIRFPVEPSGMVLPSLGALSSTQRAILFALGFTRHK